AGRVDAEEHPPAQTASEGARTAARGARVGTGIASVRRRYNTSDAARSLHACFCWLPVQDASCFAPVEMARFPSETALFETNTASMDSGGSRMATAKKAAKKPAAKKATAKKPAAKKTAVKKSAAKAPAKKSAAKKPAARSTAAKKPAARKTAAKKPAAKKTARKPNAAFMKALTPSPQLASIVGDKPLPR